MFRPGDQVYLCITGTNTREGPYQISSVPRAKSYILCNGNKEPINGGREVEERDLKLYDPFAA